MPVLDALPVPNSVNDLLRVRARRAIGMRVIMAVLVPALILMGVVLFLMVYRGSVEDTAGEAVTYFCTAYWEIAALTTFAFIEERRAMSAIRDDAGSASLISLARSPSPTRRKKPWYHNAAFWCVFLLVPVSALSFIRCTWRGRAVDLSIWVLFGIALPFSVIAILDLGPTSTWIGPVARSEAIWSAAKAGAGTSVTCAVAAITGFLAGTYFPTWRDFAGTCVLGEPSQK